MPTLRRGGGRSRHQGEAAARAITAGSKTFKVHLDGYNQFPFLTGEAKEVAAQGVPLLRTTTATSSLFASSAWKFMLQAPSIATGIDVWRQPFTTLRAPMLFDLLADPFENAFDNVDPSTRNG